MSNQTDTAAHAARNIKRLRLYAAALLAGYVGSLLLIALGVFTLLNAPATPATSTAATASITTLLNDAKAGKLASAETTGGTQVLATTKTGDTYAVAIPASYTDTLITTLAADNVDVTATTATAATATTAPAAPVGGRIAVGTTTPAEPQTSGLLSILAGSLLLIVSVVGTVHHRGMVKSHNQALTEAAQTKEKKTGNDADCVDIPDTRFDDVAGADEAVESMAELVSFLKDPQRYEKVGAKPPAGALLVGPPGTGKTLLARAVAGEAGVPFYSAAGSDFVEIYVGKGAQKVRNLFAKARKHDTALVFIDEIDAVGRARGGDPGSGADSERDNTLIALLNELDGFHASNIIVIAATNRPDVLDKALTRPGRLDRQIQVPLPDRRGREKILTVHMSTRPFAADVDAEHIARRTPGFSGADLAQVVNEAATGAARDNVSQVTKTHLDNAVAVVAMGVARKSALVTDFDKRITAYHEAGHTVAALAEKDANPPVQVSIVPRGAAGGVTWMSDTDNNFLTRTSAWSRLVVALGGREAEKLLLDGDYTSGASSDLDNATNTAAVMLTKYGMEHTLSTHNDIAGNQHVRKDIETMLTRAAQRTRTVLTDQYALVEAIAGELLENDDLDRDDLDRIVTAVTGTDIAGLRDDIRDRLGTPAPPSGWLETTDEPVSSPAAPSRGLRDKLATTARHSVTWAFTRTR